MSNLPHQRIERAGTPPVSAYPGDPGLVESRLPQEALLAAIASALVFLAGVWLVLAPFVLDYHAGADAVSATPNGIVVGIVVVALALTSGLLGACSCRRRDLPGPAGPARIR